VPVGASLSTPSEPVPRCARQAQQAVPRQPPPTVSLSPLHARQRPHRRGGRAHRERAPAARATF